MDRDTNSERLRARQGEIRDEEANLLLTPEPDGRSTRVELVVGARSVSRCWIVSQRIRIGAAVVRMDGIGGVGTDESERHKGYASRVLDAAMRRMLAGDAALTMLYGIPDFYRRFGYVPAGPEHFVRLPAADCALPSGWTSRPLRTADLPTVHSVYEAETSRAVGPAVRTASCYALRQLRAAAESPSASDGDVCRVVLDPDGDLGGYVWRGNGFWATEILERETPDSLIISEALAASAPAADAVLAVCRQWAHEVAARTGRPVTSALISAPHDGRMAAAARRTDAELVRRYVRCGGSMARILDLPRLMQALLPELAHRLRSSGIRLYRPFVLGLQSGPSCTLQRSQTGDLVARAGLPEDSAPYDMVHLADGELARAILGAVTPSDVLDRAPISPSARVRRIFSALFAERCPHMYLPDRY